MAEITNRVSLNRRYDWEKSGNRKIKTSKLGIIFTGNYPSLDEHLVEKEILKNFDISLIKEIITVGKRETTFKYANRFAKKYNLPVTPKRLETYSWEDVDFYIKRNAIINYNSDSVIIFHGEEKQNIVAWYALSTATRVIAHSGKCIFIDSTPNPNFIGLEKEVFDVLQMRHTYSDLDEYSFMEERFFELMPKERTKFVKYVQQGENMSFKQILFKLSEVYMKGNNYDFLDGYSDISDSMISSLIGLINKDFEDEDGRLNEEKIEKYIKKEINPDFRYRNCAMEEDVCFVMFYHYWYEFEYLLLDMVEDYERNNDDETCAALCFGKWITFLIFKEFEAEKIIQKYNNLQEFQ